MINDLISLKLPIIKIIVLIIKIIIFIIKDMEYKKREKRKRMEKKRGFIKINIHYYYQSHPHKPHKDHYQQNKTPHLE
jgi:hypothetical protein